MFKSKKRAKHKTKYRKLMEISAEQDNNRTLKINSTEDLNNKCNFYVMDKPFGVSSICTEAFTLGRFYNRVQKESSLLAVGKFDVSKTPESFSYSKWNAIEQLQHKNLLIYAFSYQNIYFSWRRKGIPLSNLVTFTKLSEFNISIICHDVLQGLICLHDLMIIHRNVRPENIICLCGNVKLDFKCSDDSSMSNLVADTYIAPEILEGKSYGRKVDVWSLGAVAVYMKRFDFNNCGKKVEMSPKMRAFVDRCLKKNPEKRVCSKQLAQSSFVANYGSRKMLADHELYINHSESQKGNTTKTKSTTPSKNLPTLRVEREYDYKCMYEEENDYSPIAEYGT